MNDLDRKVTEWCEQVFVDRCWYRSKNGIEELQDHLYSEIEALQGQGMDEDVAFATATKKLGDIRDLEREFTRNRSWLGRLSRNIAMSECGITKKERKMRIGNSIIWATLMIASALIFNTIDADVSRTYSYLLVVVMIPLWFASDQLMRKAARKNEA